MSEKRNNEIDLATPDHLHLDEKEEIAHLENGKEQHGQHTTLLEEAFAQREEESKMGLWKIFKLYYPGATYGYVTLLKYKLWTSLMSPVCSYPLLL
jgi:hypothetical protein